MLSHIGGGYALRCSGDAYFSDVVEINDVIDMDASLVPAKTAAIRNQICQQNVLKAWAYIVISNGAVASWEGFNVASIGTPAAAQISISWAENFNLGTSYSVMCNGWDATTSRPFSVGAGGRSSTGTILYMQTGIDLTDSPGDFSIDIQAYGLQ